MSGPVLPLTQFGEDLNRARIFHPEPCGDQGIVCTQKRVLGIFSTDGRGQGERALGPQRVDLAGALFQCGIFGIHHQRKARIRLRVFMAAIELGCCWQGAKFLQR